MLELWDSAVITVFVCFVLFCFRSGLGDSNSGPQAFPASHISEGATSLEMTGPFSEERLLLLHMISLCKDMIEDIHR